MIVGATKIRVDKDGSARLILPYCLFVKLTKDFNKKIKARTDQGNLILMF